MSIHEDGYGSGFPLNTARGDFVNPSMHMSDARNMSQLASFALYAQASYSKLYARMTKSELNVSCNGTLCDLSG